MKPKTILITAGGTSAPIDHVRAIRNTATGTLSSLIADVAHHAGHHVIYVYGPQAKQPLNPVYRSIAITNVADLAAVVTDLATTETIDAIIHAMAVSDYDVDSVIDYDKLIQSNTIETIDTRQKFSSELEHPAIILKRTPKVLAMMRPLFPNALIIGFKLLVGVSVDELVKTAMALLHKNNCDFVLANDLQAIDGMNHTAYLLDHNGNSTQELTKDAIATRIINTLQNTWEASL